jgi:hypothetical protein
MLSRKATVEIAFMKAIQIESFANPAEVVDAVNEPTVTLDKVQ